MKKLIFGSILLMLVVFSAPSIAGVNVGIGISLPPIVIGGGSPGMVVLPGTDAYADPEMDLFFYGGWWWRPWGGHWYRSHYYNSGWVSYRGVPSFYSRVPSNWRNDYRSNRWRGRQWNYQRVPHQQVTQHWQRGRR